VNVKGIFYRGKLRMRINERLGKEGKGEKRACPRCGHEVVRYDFNEQYTCPACMDGAVGGKKNGQENKM
jgi:ribosomal protein S27AE